MAPNSTAMIVRPSDTADYLLKKLQDAAGIGWVPKLGAFAVVAAVGAGCVAQYLQNRKKWPILAQKHEAKAQKWIKDYEADVAKKEEIASEDNERYQLDDKVLKALYTKAVNLSCSPLLVARLRTILIEEYSWRLKDAIINQDNDEHRFGDQILATIVSVKSFGFEWLVDENLWEATTALAAQLRRSHRLKLLSLLIQSHTQCLGMGVSFILSLVSAPLSIVKNTTLKQLIAAFLSHKVDWMEVAKWATLLVGAAFMETTTSYLKDMISDWTEHQFIHETKVNICKSIVRLDTHFFDNYTPEQVEDLICSVDYVSASIQHMVAFINAGVHISAHTWHLYNVSPHLLTMFVTSMPLYFGTSHLFNKGIEMLDNVEEPVEETSPESNLSLQEYLRNFKTLRSFGREVDIMDKRVEQYVARTSMRVAKRTNTKRKGNQSPMVVRILKSVQSLFPDLYKLGGTYFAAHLAKQGLLSTSNLYHLVHTTFKDMMDMKKEISSLGLGWVDTYAPYAAKLIALLTDKPTIDVGEGLIPKDFRGEIRFENVTFAYPTRPDRPILENVTCTMYAGEMVGLVGPSGGGKSTLFQLMQRFYDPSKGDIYVDGIDIKQYNVQWLRTQFGYVRQEPILFNMSIEDNIRFGRPSGTRDEIEAVAKLANAYDFIVKLPEGFKTKIGKKMQLSGGQKQRVAIARAMLMHPKVLLLDEATSALDSRSEREIQKSLNEMFNQRTTISIAHRLSTVEHADQLVVIADGTCIEKGTHSHLMEVGGMYASLVQHQQLQGPLPDQKGKIVEIEAIPDPVPVVVSTPSTGTVTCPDTDLVASMETSPDPNPVDDQEDNGDHSLETASQSGKRKRKNNKRSKQPTSEDGDE